MQKINSIISFIQKHKLLSRRTYGSLIYSARRQGYIVREWQRNLTRDEQLLEFLKCRELSHYRDAFTYKDENKGLIFISRCLPEYEKIILLKHELIHIHLGQIRMTGPITVTEENETTDFAHTVEIILKLYTTLEKSFKYIIAGISILLVIL